MAKGPKKVMLTPKEQAIRVVRKPKADKTSTTTSEKAAPKPFLSGIAPMTRQVPENAKQIRFDGKAIVNVLDAEQVPRQPFHNRVKNRKPKAAGRR